MLQARADGNPSIVEQFETRRDVIQMQQRVVTALEARLVALQVGLPAFCTYDHTHTLTVRLQVLAKGRQPLLERILHAPSRHCDVIIDGRQAD